jgi:hypothetical protein
MLLGKKDRKKRWSNLLWSADTSRMSMITWLEQYSIRILHLCLPYHWFSKNIASGSILRRCLNMAGYWPPASGRVACATLGKRMTTTQPWSHGGGPDEREWNLGMVDGSIHHAAPPTFQLPPPLDTNQTSTRSTVPSSRLLGSSASRPHATRSPGSNKPVSWAHRPQPGPWALCLCCRERSRLGCNKHIWVWAVCYFRKFRDLNPVKFRLKSVTDENSR